MFLLWIGDVEFKSYSGSVLVADLSQELVDWPWLTQKVEDVASDREENVDFRALVSLALKGHCHEDFADFWSKLCLNYR